MRDRCHRRARVRAEAPGGHGACPGLILAFSRKLWFSKLSELWAADPWEGFGRAKGLMRPSRLIAKKRPIGLDTSRALYAEMSGMAAHTVRNAHKLVYASS